MKGLGQSYGETEKKHNKIDQGLSMDEFEKTIKIGPMKLEQEQQFKKIIEKYKDLCALSTTKLGRTHIVKHEINTGDNRPIASKPYKTTSENKKIIKQELEKIEKDGVIRSSHSPWSSPVVIVNKKDGTKRFCVDYRKINDVTITDSHPLPRIDELLEQFRVAKWFSSMDLASGYWQIEVKKEDKPKTAFTCSYGLYEFNVMPFGLKNAPPTFQRLMNELFRPYLDEFVVIYIDDILIYSRTFEEHLKHLEIVFKVLKDAGIIVKLKKCKFCESNMEFLGHIVGKDGLRPDPGKIDKIKNLKRPVKVKDVRSVLGLCSYYRKFVKDFSRIAKPLNNLLKKESEFVWKEEHQKAFEMLKKKLIQSPILQYPDYNKEFILITDASGIGLGAVLSQYNDDNREVVIAYASKSLVGAEQNYPITELECLAVIWAVQHFHKYLIRTKFTIITDHSALKTLKTAKMPKGKHAKWMMELQQYDYKIKHRSGKSNGNADALSRL